MPTTSRKLSAITLAAFMLATASAAQTHNGYELPPYQVLAKDNVIELRKYAPHLALEYRGQGSRSGVANKGFRTLAGYIFGGNDADQKIAMTAPVAQEQVGQEWQVRFIVPAAYDRSTLPKPDDAQVTFVDQPASTQLTITFSGRWTQSRLQQKESELRSYAAAQGHTVIEGPFYYFYDDPFTLPWKRRNEVAFKVQ